MTTSEAPATAKRVPPIWPQIAASLLLTFGAYGLLLRPYIPGQWLRDQGVVPLTACLLMAAGLISLVTIIELLQRRKPLWAILLVALAVAPCYLPWPKPRPAYRYRAERADYQRAVRTGPPFGDQHRETVDGRPLTYWRWISYGIDNASGVIYDPEDRLSRESDPDRRAFLSVTGGILAGVTRLEPGWYYVTHT